MFEKLTLHEAFQSVKQIRQPDLHVSVATLYNLIQFCINEKNICIGRKVHALIVECGYESNLFLASHTIRLFAVCGTLAEVNQAFGKVKEPDDFTWNAIISAHTKLGNDELALSFYHQLNSFGFSLDAHIFVAVLKACHNLEDLFLIHAQLIEAGVYGGIYIPVTLLDVYTKYGNIEEVLSVVTSLQEKTVVAWNAVIKACNHHGRTDDALQFFLQMQAEGIFPTHVTIVIVLKTCSNAASLSQGRILHSQALTCGFDSNVSVRNTLIDMYAKCTRLDDAYRVFDSSSKRDVVTWNAMIAGYVQQGHVSEAFGVFYDMQQTGHAGNERNAEAFNLFNGMQVDGVDPNEVTFIALLNLCSNIVVIDLGMLIHTHIIEMGLEADLPLSNSLVNMYANCGALHDACKLLERSPQTNVVTWNALIAGCTKQSDLEAALSCLKMMRVAPNDVTFVSILSLCNHMGMVDEALFHLTSMTTMYDILPRYEHYMCTLDLLGRIGFFDEAEDIVNTMPVCPDFVALASLLNHCKTYKNTELARQYFNGVISFNSRSAFSFVSMSSIYDFEGLKEFRHNANAWKKPGMACLEVKEETYMFVVGDKASGEIGAKLKSLIALMRWEGYLPQAADFGSVPSS